MANGNAEVVRGVYDSWCGEDVTRALGYIDPAIVWEAIPDAPDAGTYRGHPGVRRHMEDWLGDFEILSMDFKEVTDVGDRLVIAHCAHTRARRSGIETEMHYAVAYWFESGKIVQIKEFRTKAEALAAPGPPEGRQSPERLST